MDILANVELFLDKSDKYWVSNLIKSIKTIWVGDTMKVKKSDNLVVQVYNNLVPSLRLLKHQLLYVTVFAEDETADDSVVVAAVVVVP